MDAYIVGFHESSKPQPQGVDPIYPRVTFKVFLEICTYYSKVPL